MSDENKAKIAIINGERPNFEDFIKLLNANRGKELTEEDIIKNAKIYKEIREEVFDKYENESINLECPKDREIIIFFLQYYGFIETFENYKKSYFINGRYYDCLYYLSKTIERENHDEIFDKIYSIYIECFPIQKIVEENSFLHEKIENLLIGNISENSNEHVSFEKYKSLTPNKNNNFFIKLPNSKKEAFFKSKFNHQKNNKFRKK